MAGGSSAARTSSGRGKRSPLLLVRAPQQGRVIVADGYHRLCAVYSFDVDSDIPRPVA